MSGLSFALGGNKRAAPQPSRQAKKPATVNELFAADSDEEGDVALDPKRQRTQVGVASSKPAGLTLEVQTAASKLAEFVAKNGRSFEDLTRKNNPGETVFKFLHDKISPAYQYYDAKVREFEACSASSRSGAPPPSAPPQRHAPHTTSVPSLNCTAAPVPALTQATLVSVASLTRPSAASASSSAPSRPRSRWDADPPVASSASPPAAPAPPADSSLAAMDFYMSLAAKKEEERIAAAEAEERARAEPLLNSTSFERRKVVAVYREDGSRGHHMQDFIPPEELAKFMAKAGDKSAETKLAELEEANRISEDNIGHKLLQKMGWKAGEGIGASGAGITAPVSASSLKQDNLGLGAAAHGEVNTEDDAFEQYRKRMMLGYKYRPNPLGNPRKSYY